MTENTRETFEANARFMDETNKRLERNEVSIDELEALAVEFAKARKFCEDRLNRIEAAVKNSLDVATVERD